MPDFAMCYGEDCPQKEECYRYLAIEDDYRQTYFAESPYQEEIKRCSFFWPIETVHRKEQILNFKNSAAIDAKQCQSYLDTKKPQNSKEGPKE